MGRAEAAGALLRAHEDVTVPASPPRYHDFDSGGHLRSGDLREARFRSTRKLTRYETVAEEATEPGARAPSSDLAKRRATSSQSQGAWR